MTCDEKYYANCFSIDHRRLVIRLVTDLNLERSGCKL